MSDRCGNWCVLAPDVLASAQVPHERVSRELTCQREPHGAWDEDGEPCEADGWAWKNGRIWRVENAKSDVG